MIEKMIVNINEEFQRYEKLIEKIKEYDINSERLKIDVSAVYYYKYDLFYSIESLKHINHIYIKLKNKYDRITQGFIIHERKTGTECHKILFDTIKINVKRYAIIIKYFGDPDDLDFFNEIGNALFMRDGLEFSLIELENDYDLQDLKFKITVLDTVLKTKFTEKIERIVECCPSFETSYYPENFWWRHPSKILAEKQARVKQQSE